MKSDKERIQELETKHEICSVSVHDAFNDLGKKVDVGFAEIKQIFHGNGKLGVLTRLDRVEQSKLMSKNNSDNKFWKITTVVTLIIACGGLIAAILK